MGRGEIEQTCFDSAKHALFSENEICYACSDEDKKIIKNIFETSMPNPKASKFPDFIFDGGFIEHFQVSSSHSNRNGSTMKHEQNKLKKDSKMKEDSLMAEMSDTPSYEGKTISTDIWHREHSYENFFSSFKRSWEKHIESLEKYKGDKSIGIFMIQYDDSALVLDAFFPNVKTELYYGDLLERPKYRGYRITHDSNVLEYIYQFKEKFKYVVFFNNDSFRGLWCEIICVENIPEILKIVKGKFRFHCIKICSGHYIHGVSIPNSFCKGNDENDQT